MNKPHSKHAPVIKKPDSRSGQVIQVRSFISEHCPLDCEGTLWSCRLPVTSLALFMPQGDHPPATSASSGPLNLLFCLQHMGRVNSELSFKAGPGITASRKPTPPYLPFSGLTLYLLFISITAFITHWTSLVFISVFLPYSLPLIPNQSLSTVPSTN